MTHNNRIFVTQNASEMTLEQARKYISKANAHIYYLRGVKQAADDLIAEQQSKIKFYERKLKP